MISHYKIGTVTVDLKSAVSLSVWALVISAELLISQRILIRDLSTNVTAWSKCDTYHNKNVIHDVLARQTRFCVALFKIKVIDVYRFCINKLGVIIFYKRYSIGYFWIRDFFTKRYLRIYYTWVLKNLQLLNIYMFLVVFGF